MTTTHYILIAIYFYINCFIAGYHYCDNEIDFSDPWKDTARTLLGMLLFVLISSLLYLCATIWHGMVSVWDFINKYTGLKFFFNFYIMKEFDKCDQDHLKRINRRLDIYNSKSIPDWFYRKGVKMINERNKFTYIAKDDEDNSNNF